MEHALGHTQPHVMDVGEMLPGHLRLFASARRTVLLQKAMSFSLTRARNARNQASDTIKEVYSLWLLALSPFMLFGITLVRVNRYICQCEQFAMRLKKLKSCWRL
jgi:hypothetical protein